MSVSVIDATTGATFRKTVASAGTAVQVTTDDRNLSVGVVIRALAGNTGKVYFGFSNTVSSTTGFELSPGEGLYLEIKRASVLWLDAATNGDGVCGVMV